MWHIMPHLEALHCLFASQACFRGTQNNKLIYPLHRLVHHTFNVWKLHINPAELSSPPHLNSRFGSLLQDWCCATAARTACMSLFVSHCFSCFTMIFENIFLHFTLIFFLQNSCFFSMKVSVHVCSLP